MQFQKKLSIIIPVLNYKRVERAINSVLKYKSNKIELIVVDGLSTDGTREIILKMKSDIDYFVSEKDDGITQAFNKGIGLSSGEWIFSLAADDILICDPMKIIDKYDDGSVDVICGSIICEREKKYGFDFSEPNLQLLDYYCSLKHPASFYKRTVYLRYGMPDESYKCAGDREMFLRLYKNSAQIKVIPEYIVIFASGGLSAQPKYCYKEDLIISKKYGINRLNCTVYYYYRYIRYFGSKIKRSFAKLLGLKSKTFKMSYTDICEIIKCQNEDLNHIHRAILNVVDSAQTQGWGVNS